MRAKNVFWVVVVGAAAIVAVSSAFYDKKQQLANMMFSYCVENLKNLVGTDLTVDDGAVWPEEKPKPQDRERVAASVHFREGPGRDVLEPKALVNFRVGSGRLEHAMCEYAAWSFDGKMSGMPDLMKVMTDAPQARVPVYRPLLGIGQSMPDTTSKERFLLLYRIATSKVTVH